MAELSATQTRYLALAWLCFESEPKVDYARFAQLAGLKSAASAREMLRVTKKKLLEHAPENDGDASAPSTPVAKTPKTPRKKGTTSTGKGKGRKRKADSDDDDDDEDEVMQKKAKVVVKNEPVEEDVAEEQEETEV